MTRIVGLGIGAKSDAPRVGRNSSRTDLESDGLLNVRINFDT